MTDEPKAGTSAALIALLDDPKIAAALRVRGEERPRMVIAGGSEAVCPATIAALEGAALTVLCQSGGQIAEALTDDAAGWRKWWGAFDVRFDDVAGLRRMLDRCRFDALDDGTDTVAVPLSTYDALRKLDPSWGRHLLGLDDWIMHGIPGRDNESGLLTRKPEPKPLPPSTMTRQQRRYLARKGRTND